MIPFTPSFLFTLLVLILNLNLQAQNEKSNSDYSDINTLTVKYYESINKNPVESLIYAEEAFSYYNKITNNNTKFTVTSNYATALYINGRYKQALTVLDRADKTQLQEKQKALYFTIRGLTENDLNNFTEAESHFSEALLIYQKLEDKDNEFAILNNLGLLHNNIGDYRTSLEYYLKCYDIVHALKAKVDRYKYFMNIGTVNFNLKNFEAALKSFSKGLDIAKNNADSLRVFRSHEKSGHAHASLNQSKTAITHYKKALTGYESLDLAKEICSILINLGDTYNRIGKSREQSLSYQRALSVAEENDFTQERFLATFKLAETYQQSDVEKAKLYYEKIIDNTNHIVNQKIIRDAYHALYEIEKETHPLVALNYLEAFLAAENTIREKRAITQNEQIEARFDLKKKDFELRELRDSNRLNELELKNKTQKIRSLVLFAILSIMLLILILTMLIQKRKAEKALAQKNERINNQNKELLQTNNEIKERRKELTELNKIKSQLLSVIAHDVKSPMTDLYNLLAILRSNINIISKQELIKNLAVIESNTSNILNLLNNILNWIISQSSGFKVKISSFSLKELVDDNLKLIESSRVAKDLNIIFKENKSVDTVTSDRNIVDFVLRNLLSNAVKFTGEKGEIVIEILAKSNSTVAIRIEDSGIGLNEEIHKLLKDNKERVPSERGTNSEEGYGIGLALGKKMLAKINSEINYQKNHPTGSIFTLNLRQK